MMQWSDVLQKVGLIGLGGFLGANARFWLGTWIQQRYGMGFPWGTFIVNVSGSFVLGFFMTFVIERLGNPQAQALRLLVATGFVGAYTTFSTLEYETFTLVEAGTLFLAFGNVLGSLVAGFFAVWLGVALARVL